MCMHYPDLGKLTFITTVMGSILPKALCPIFERGKVLEYDTNWLGLFQIRK